MSCLESRRRDEGRQEENPAQDEPWVTLTWSSCRLPGRSCSGEGRGGGKEKEVEQRPQGEPSIQGPKLHDHKEQRKQKAEGLTATPVG